jgi:hypothetical protein
MMDFECLVAILGRLESKIDGEQEKLEARHEKLVNQEKMEDNQEKLEAKMEVYPEKLEAMVEHHNRASHVKPCKCLSPCRTQLLMLCIKSVNKQHMKKLLGQLKTWTQDNGESLQEFATDNEQLTHCAFPPPLRKDHICRGPGKVFSSCISD